MDDATLTMRIAAFLGRVPTIEWRPDGPAYTPAEIGVNYGTIPDDQDRAIGLRVYGQADGTDVRRRRLQVMLRGRPYRLDDADQLAHVVEAVLTQVSRESGISGISRESMAPLGADKNGREERSDNYLVILDNLEASS